MDQIELVVICNPCILQVAPEYSVRCIVNMVSLVMNMAAKNVNVLSHKDKVSFREVYTLGLK